MILLSIQSISNGAWRRCRRLPNSLSRAMLAQAAQVQLINLTARVLTQGRLINTSTHGNRTRWSHSRVMAPRGLYFFTVILSARCAPPYTLPMHIYNTICHSYRAHFSQTTRFHMDEEQQQSWREYPYQVVPPPTVPPVPHNQTTMSQDCAVSDTYQVYLVSSTHS